MANTSLTMVILSLTLVAFLMAANVSKISKDTPLDEKAYNYSVAAMTLSFLGLGLIAGSLLKTNYYLLIILTGFSIGLVGLTFTTYDKLNSAESTNNINERKISLASFCIALVSLTFGFSFFLTHHLGKISSGSKSALSSGSKSALSSVIRTGDNY